MVDWRQDLPMKTILKAGAKIIETPSKIFKKADLIVKVKEPQLNEGKMIREGQIIYTYFI